MPKYNFSDADLQSLADFVLALDFSKYPRKILPRQEILESAPTPANATSAGDLNGPRHAP
jgi:hypothetical protein